jgi:pSer/pThr/pTyr-binding forkhead associated (FHA) protein
MKLFFPKGEHAAVEIADGVLVIGSSPASQVVLDLPGVAPRHCEVTAQGERVSVAPLAMSAPTLLNGKAITAATEIKGGDLLMIAGVACRAVASERKAAAPAAPTVRADESGATRVRMALPKFVLRGVSGATFGKVFPVHASMVVGRASDCDICIASEEISRRHARLQLVPEGLMVEDMGSANGTYVNDQRVAGPTLLRAGGELRMDVVRFQLLTPGSESDTKVVAPAASPAKSSSALVWVVVGVVVLAVAAFAAWKAHLF